MSKAYLWTDGRGVIALYPATPARPPAPAVLSKTGHALSGRGR